jgi:protein-disulfide isomerase
MAVIAIAGCNSKPGDAATNTPVTVKPVDPPKDGDWSKIVTATPEGGFLMGNPNAKVRLVEFGSMTCPHCAEFEEQGVKALIDNYVKKGLVSYEFRNYVRDPFDVAASLVARCGGEAGFFGLTRGLYAEQRDWVGKIQAADPAKMQSLQTMPPGQQFATIADLAGLKQFAAMRGVPRAKAEACLADEAAINQLVQMNSDAQSTYNIPGTPAFLINGTLVEQVAAWSQLEPKIKEALAG